MPQYTSLNGFIRDLQAVDFDLSKIENCEERLGHLAREIDDIVFITDWVDDDDDIPPLAEALQHVPVSAKSYVSHYFDPKNFEGSMFDSVQTRNALLHYEGVLGKESNFGDLWLNALKISILDLALTDAFWSRYRAQQLSSHL